MRALIALGGNAMTGPDGSATPRAQREAIRVAMGHVAQVVAAGHEVVLTHGNGPQVGNLLVKNELAAHVVPPVPLDWCGAQTQGTIGFTMLDMLEPALAARGLTHRVAALVTRTVVDPDDPGFARPTKPIGRYLPHEQALRLIEHGETWEDRGERGWRRLVASPQPVEVLEVPALLTLLAAGFVVVAAGGGGVPVVRGATGSVHGVEAVIDKDLTAALLARAVDADALVIATDVESAVLAYGTPHARPLGRVPLAELEGYAADGQFASGSMGPKVEAAIRFVRSGGGRSVITALDRIADALEGTVGTIVEGPADRPGSPGHSPRVSDPSPGR
jgi:carbamate kinase